MRVGMGYDAHRFAAERRLVLCGVEVPHTLGLLGHSDADVATHALMDALLGAAGLGDIGQHFPDSDPAYKGISSLKLLEKVVLILKQKGYGIANADVTIIAQEPKLAPYRQQMADILTGIVGAPVNVKATTTEGMGFAGRREGIAAQAIALLTEQ